MEAIVAVLVPILVPYVTEAIRALWGKVFSSIPGWLGPFKAVVAGAIVAKLSALLGVTLPSDLAHVTGDQTALILNTVILGTGGAWIHDVVTKLKDSYGTETAVGKAIRSVAGS